RFAELASFTTVKKRSVAGDNPPLTAAGVFCDLLDAVVDRLADVLERISGELDALSHRLFRAEPAEPPSRRRSAGESANLRLILRRVGHNGDLASKIRDSLLGIGRIVPFVVTIA